MAPPKAFDWATDDNERLAKDQIFRHQGCRPNHR
jgi:hypothetical protein